MDDSDVFFTQTIVGAPFTVMLGRRQMHSGSGREGLNIDTQTGEARLTRLWQEWIVLSHKDDPGGQPRRRPGRLRRVLERHALWVAILGLLSLVSTLAFWGWMTWS